MEKRAVAGSLDAPREKIVTTPPLIVVEVLSPEDRIGRYKERLDVYRKLGVKNIRVVAARVDLPVS
jgi:Uma2 family endonuclease